MLTINRVMRSGVGKKNESAKNGKGFFVHSRQNTTRNVSLNDVKHVKKISALPKLKSKAKLKERTLNRKRLVDQKFSVSFPLPELSPHMFSLPSMPKMSDMVPPIKVGIDDDSKSWISDTLSRLMETINGGIKVDHTHSVNFSSMIPDFLKDAFNFASDKVGHMLAMVVFIYQTAKKMIGDKVESAIACIQSVFDFVLLSLKSVKDASHYISSDLLNMLSKFSTAIVKTICSWIAPTPDFEEHSLSDSSMYLAVIGLVTFMWNGYEVSLNSAVKIVKNLLLFDGKKNIEISFFGFLEAVQSTFSSLADMTGIDFFKRFGMPVPEFAEEMQEIELKHFALLSEVSSTKALPPWNKEDITKMKDLLERMTRRIFEVKSNSQKTLALTKIRDSLTKILSVAMTHVNKVGDYRPEPNGYCLTGAAGLGKTTLMHYINVAFIARTLKGDQLLEFMASPAGQVYNAVVGSPYDEHYADQLVLALDDLMADRTSAGTPGDGSKIIRLVNTNPYLLNAAAVELKSKLAFTSRVISATSNVTQIRAKDVADISCLNAVIRRIPYVMSISTEKNVMFLQYAKDNPLKTMKQILDEYYVFRRVNWVDGKDHRDQSLLNFSQFVDMLVREDQRRIDFHENTFMAGMRGIIDEFSGLDEHMFPIPMSAKFNPQDLNHWQQHPKLLFNNLMNFLVPGAFFELVKKEQPNSRSQRVFGFDTKETKKTRVSDKAFNIAVSGDLDNFQENYSKLLTIITASGIDVYQYFCGNRETALKDHPNLYHCRGLYKGDAAHFYEYLAYMIFIGVSHLKIGSKLRNLCIDERHEFFFKEHSDDKLGYIALETIHSYMKMFCDEMALNVPGFRLAYECMRHVCNKSIYSPDYKFVKHYTLDSNAVQGWLPDYLWSYLLDVYEEDFPQVSICAYLDKESFRNCVITGVHFDVAAFMRVACFAAVTKYKKDHAPVQHYLTTLFNTSRLATFALTLAGFLAMGHLISRTIGSLIPLASVREEQSGRLTKANKQHVVRPQPLPKLDEGLSEHAVNHPASNGLVSKVLNNTIVFSTDKDGVTHGSFLLLKENHAIGLVHYLATFEDLHTNGCVLWGRRGDANPKEDSSYFPINLEVLITQCFTPSDGIDHDVAYYTVESHMQYNGVSYKPFVGKDLTKSMLTKVEFSDLIIRPDGIKKNFPTLVARPGLRDMNSKVCFPSISSQIGAVIGNIQYGSNGDYKVSNAIMAKYPCARGYCGSTMICTDTRNQKQVAIVGIHCSGNTATGVGISAPFYLEDFMQYYQHVGRTPRFTPELVEHGVRAMPPGWKVLDAEPRIEFFKDLGFDTRMPFMNETSRLVKNIFWDQCNNGEVSGNAPAILDRKTGLDPLFSAQSKYGAPCAKPHLGVMHEAADAVDEIYLNPKFAIRCDRKLTKDETLVGVEDGFGKKIIGGTKSSTSPGWPLNNISHDKSAWVKDGQIVRGPELDKLYTYIDTLIEKLKVDETTEFICLDNLKDEVRKIGVDGVVKGARLISCADLGSVCVTKIYFASFLQFINDNRIYNGSSIGVNPYKEFNDIWRIFNGWLLAEGDFGSYDGNIWKELYIRFAHCANKWYSIHDKGWKPEDDEVRLNIVRAISSTVHLSGYGQDKNFAMVEDHQSSGNLLTANANTYIGTVIGKINLYKIYLEGEKKKNLCSEVPTYGDLFDKGVRAPREVLHSPSMQNGDDHFLAIPKCMEYMTPGDFSRSMNELGYKHTDSRKGVSSDEPMTLKDVSYLKREFVEFKHRYVGRLELPSILKMIEYGKASQTQEEECQVVDSMLMECAPHGMEKFRALSTKLQKYCEMKEIQPVFLALGKQDRSYEASYSKASAAFLDCDDFYMMM